MESNDTAQGQAAARAQLDEWKRQADASTYHRPAVTIRELIYNGETGDNRAAAERMRISETPTHYAAVGKSHTLKRIADETRQPCYTVETDTDEEPLITRADGCHHEHRTPNHYCADMHRQASERIGREVDAEMEYERQS